MSMNKMQWLNHFYQLIETDPVRAALEARLNYHLIDREMLAFAQSRAASAASSWQIEQNVSTQMGALGFSSTPNYGMGAASSGASMAFQILHVVASYNGDPPATPAMQQNAMAILQGKIPPDRVLRMAGSQAPPFVQQMLPMVDMMMAFDPSVGMLLDQVARIMAALALPRPELLRLFGIVEEEEDEELTEVDLARLEFAEAIEEAEKYKEYDPAKAETILMHALEHAQQTPEPDDDIQALMQLMLLCQYNHSLTDKTIIKAASAVKDLVEERHRGDALGQIASMLIVMAGARKLAGKLDQLLSRNADMLLAGDLSQPVRIALSQATAACWLRQGDADRAQRMVRKIKKMDLTAADLLSVAQLKADVHWQFEDREGAVDVLVEALQKAKGEEQGRIQALQKLACVWPAERPGIEPFIDELESMVADLGEPMKTLAIMGTVVQLFQREQLDRARGFSKMMNIEEMREQVPAGMLPMVDTIEKEWRGIEKQL